MPLSDSNRERVVGFENFTNGTVYRRDHFVASRFDGNPIAHNFFAKATSGTSSMLTISPEREQQFDSSGVFLVIRNQRFQFIKQTHDLS